MVVDVQVKPVRPVVEALRDVELAGMDGIAEDGIGVKQREMVDRHLDPAQLPAELGHDSLENRDGCQPAGRHRLGEC